ncbi:uncharacterized protein LOC110629366 isoform X2 [Manihot esculenta]|uniref:uncharacterized protein LOC110629366 isoform X2 n=1 Tax=Manihot esculenta TaxID=3983 RepID=UPI000B5D7D9C|nr:uncharacterized protein LOC110629366 isoform X2 [Manihot esculenta]
MDWSSWFRRTAKNAKSPNQQQQQNTHEDEEELLGVTSQLINHVKSFTLDTFKNFPLQDGTDGTVTFSDEILAATETTSANIRKDLSQWQERHATLVLSKVKELSQLRFRLCPRHLKERDFWRIYFALVKSYVAEYELQAIRVAKIKRIAMEKEISSDSGAFEVEMAETKQAASLEPQPHEIAPS